MAYTLDLGHRNFVVRYIYPSPNMVHVKYILENAACIITGRASSNAHMKVTHMLTMQLYRAAARGVA